MVPFTFMEDTVINLFAIKIFLAGVIAVVLSFAEREIVYPVATVMLGGLISSMVLDFMKKPTTSSFNARNAPACPSDGRSDCDESDEDDHGLPPTGITEAHSLRNQHASSRDVFDGGMVAAIDS